MFSQRCDFNLFNYSDCFFYEYGLEEYVNYYCNSDVDSSALKVPFSETLPSSELAEEFNIEFDFSCSQIMEMFLKFIKVVKKSNHKEEYLSYKLNIHDFIDKFFEIIDKVLKVELNNRVQISYLFELPLEVIKKLFRWQEEWNDYSEEDMKSDLETQLSECNEHYDYVIIRDLSKNQADKLVNLIEPKGFFDSYYFKSERNLYLMYGRDEDENYAFNFDTVLLLKDFFQKNKK